MNFFSKSPRNLPKTRLKKLSKAYARFSEGSDAINDVRRTIASLLLIFNKIVDFRQQMLFFRHVFDFYMDERANLRKNNICCRKTTFLLKISNNDAMMLSATIIASGAPLDYSIENQLSEARFSKNRAFRQKVKIDFELHICCHGYDLSDITNWQHIGGGSSGRNFCRNFCLPRPGTLNFHLCRRLFSHFDKINNFRQQK